MNQIQLYEHLKFAPQDVLVKYAQNPSAEVPQFLAMAALQFQKEMKEGGNQAQPPQGTIKDALIQQIMQGQQQVQPTQPPMPQQQMQPQQPVMHAAHGGLAELHVPDHMFQEHNMAGGGIVAFDGGGGVNEEQLQSNLEFLNQQYAALPADSPQKAQVAAAIDQIDRQLNAQEDSGVAALPTKTPTKTEGYSGLNLPAPTTGQQEAISQINALNAGIPALVRAGEISEEGGKKIREAAIKERRDIFDPVEAEVSGMLADTKARIDKRYQNSELWSAFKGFARMASTKSPHLGVAFGEGLSEFGDAYDKSQAAEEAARNAYTSMSMNYKTAEAARKVGDLDAADARLKDAKADKRDVAKLNIQAVTAQGNLIGESAKAARGITEEKLKFYTAATDRIKVNQGEKFDRMFAILKKDPASKGLSDSRIALAAAMALEPSSFAGGKAGTNLAGAGKSATDLMQFGGTPTSDLYRTAVTKAGAAGSDTRPAVEGGKEIKDTNGKTMTEKAYYTWKAEQLKKQIIAEARNTYGVDEVQAGGGFARQIFTPWLGGDATQQSAGTGQPVVPNYQYKDGKLVPVT
jgi:hypothetical protein